MAKNQEFEEEGMMFVGDKGKILGGFHAEDPHLISGPRMRTDRATSNSVESAPRRAGRGGRRGGDPSARNAT